MARRPVDRPVFRQDERGVLQVMEAIMAAMILLGAILFVTLSSSPVRETGAAGISLSTLAGDTLTVLERQQGVDDPSITRLEEVVNLAMQGDVTNAERFLDAAVPQGTRYSLRLDNGVEPLPLIPASSSLGTAPRAASGAVTYMLANWTAYSSPTVSVAPGESFNFTGWTSINAPDGSSVGPGGDAWIDIWADLEPGRDRVPAAVPYGVWSCGGCTGINQFRVVLEDGTEADRPLVAVQLLLWEGV